ncbi:hypothetical protein HWV62_1633 [Athelia sp. TMB]|nr:hypothetical protein HWV62_1633 [Athelia sp. TMB]
MLLSINAAYYDMDHTQPPPQPRRQLLDLFDDPHVLSPQFSPAQSVPHQSAALQPHAHFTNQPSATAVTWPPHDQSIPQYGYGFGDDFELDYNDLDLDAMNKDPSATHFYAKGRKSPVGVPPLPARHDTPVPTTLTPAPPATANKPPAKRVPRVKWSFKDLKGLAAAVAQVNPYGCKHGMTQQAWEEVSEKLKEEGLCLTVPVGSLRNKMSAILAHHINPSSSAGASIAKELGDETNKAVIAALVDRVAAHKAASEKLNEESKAKARAKAEYDETGGNAIRQASLVGMRRARSEAELTEDPSDIENQPPSSGRKLKKKHRGLSKQSSEGSDEFVGVFREAFERSERQRAAEHREMTNALQQSTRVYERMQEKTLEALLNLAK